MKYIISYSLILIFGIFFIFGCAEIKEDITAPQEVKVHGENSLNTKSKEFHAWLVEDGGFNECESCHAVDYSGGTAGISCATADCHPTITVHQEGINNPSNDNFHGLFIANNDSFYECRQCHGDNWNGGIVSPTCETCHTGISVHKEGFKNPSNENFHGNFIRSNNWDLEPCSQCHASDYSGGIASIGCLTCHRNEGGPEACNTCHGDFSDPTNIAPPQGTNNETLTTEAAVGAHQVHLYNIQISENVSCSECHSIPSQFSSEGHIDDTERAEVIFGNYVNYGDGIPVYNFENMTCENSYCHGNFKFETSSGVPIYGNNFAPKWTVVDGSQAKCGTCHGEIDEEGNLVTPQPTGHVGSFTITQCWNCHPRVVDNEGNIIDKTLHINGEKDIF